MTQRSMRSIAKSMGMEVPLPPSETPEEPKPPRPKDEILKEYSQYCRMAGELSYRIAVMKEDLLRAQKRMYELNLEVPTAPAPEPTPEAPPQDAA